MYLSQETISILKNFSSINQNIFIKKGSQLRTLSTQKDILAEATITEVFDRDVGIYDLSEFLNCLSLVASPEVNLKDNHIEITDGKNTIKYRYSDPSVLNLPPDKGLSLPSEDVKFVLYNEALNSIKKASLVLKIPDISFVGDGVGIELRVSDAKNTGSNNYVIKLDDPAHSFFNMNIKVESLKLYPGDYDVVMSSKMLAKFTHRSSMITYYVAVDVSNSTFEV